jgi:dTDP-3-amino-3,4,6-trideoxy-alpha-D-glucose transaminase
VVIEDACQAHGALYKGQRVGSLGHTAAFSFYPTKNLGACGDGGILVTNDAAVAEKVRAMRNCGQRTKNVHELAPFNHRLDTLQAAILRVKLGYLDARNEARQRCAALYTQRLAGAEVVTPSVAPDGNHVYHLYVVRASRRDALQGFLRRRGVGTAVHYPLPVHLQPFYAEAGFRRGQFPVAEQLTGDVLSLPMFPELTTEQVEYVAAQVREFETG